MSAPVSALPESGHGWTILSLWMCAAERIRKGPREGRDQHPSPRDDGHPDGRVSEGQGLCGLLCGPHCDGTNKPALRLARLGLPVKMMIGGVTGWIDEGLH
jgi:hypothetical protein